MAVSYAFDCCPGSRPSRGGLMITSWITRPSRTQPKCHSPMASLTTLPSSSKYRPSMSQLPTSRPNSISLSAYSGNGPSAWSASIIGEAVWGAGPVAMRRRYRALRLCTVTILRLWGCPPLAVFGRSEAGENGPQLFELALGQDLSRLPRRDPERAAEPGAEVAVVAEAGLDCQRRAVALALGEPLQRQAEPQSQGIARDRLHRDRADPMCLDETARCPAHGAPVNGWQRRMGLTTCRDAVPCADGDRRVPGAASGRRGAAPDHGGRFGSLCARREPTLCPAVAGRGPAHRPARDVCCPHLGSSSCRQEHC